MKGLSRMKAKKMLHEGVAKGHKITSKQRGLFDFFDLLPGGKLRPPEEFAPPEKYRPPETLAPPYERLPQLPPQLLFFGGGTGGGPSFGVGPAVSPAGGGAGLAGTQQVVLRGEAGTTVINLVVEVAIPQEVIRQGIQREGNTVVAKVVGRLRRRGGILA